ncbi:putative zinc finger protein [Orchesella cincta]|uniref:Putative zinc finger protein n=1 Tax=Orchesella cincta TaxID=48709 RepID=A0A1D2NGD1_ORCCI|nr:putative zinc finger protein [Orchesella cincta]
MAQNVLAGDLCIICNSANLVKRNNPKRKSKKFTGTKKERQRLEEKLLIAPQLRPLFVLKEIFKHPMKNARELLRRMGNPSEWFQICGPCGDHIDQAMGIQKKLKKLEVQLKKVKKGLRQKLYASNLQEIHLETEQVGDVVEERRSAFRTEIRKTIPLISKGYAFATATTESFIPTAQMGAGVKAEVMYSETDLVDAEDEPYFDSAGNEQSDSEDLSHDSHWNSFINVGMGTDITTPDTGNPPPKKQKIMLLPTRILPDRTKAPEIIDKRIPRKRNKKRKPYYYVPITEGVKNSDEETDLANSCKIRKQKNPLDDCESDDPTYVPGQPLLRKKKTVKRYVNLEEEGLLLKKELDEDVDGIKLNERKKKQKKMACFKTSVQRAKNLIRKRTESTTTNKPIPKKLDRWRRLLDCGHELLDMTLITYPPKTAAEKRKIPNKLAETEVGAVRNEHGEKPFATDFGCPSCQKYFSDKYFAISHIHRFHLGIRRHWKCNKCSMKFVDARRLLKHLQLHDAGQILTCPICNTFTSGSQRKLHCHVADHQKNVPNPACDPCGKVYHNFLAYLHHMEAQHGVKLLNRFGMKTVVCEICSESFKYAKTLKFHQVVSHDHVDEHGQFPICPHCGKRYLKASSLENHIQKDHVKTKNFFCDQCGLGYALDSQLKNHIASVHTEGTPATCHVCGFVVPNRKEFLRHMSKHHSEVANMSTDELEAYVKRLNEEKPHKCKLCDNRFPFSVLLYHHYRKEHEEVTDKYKCSVCGKGYSRACSVKRHYETVHEKKTATCQYCNKELPISSLYQHLYQTKSCGAKRKAELEAQNATVVVKEDPAVSSASTVADTHKITPFFDPFCDNRQSSSSQTQQFENLNEPVATLMNATQEGGRWEEVPIKFSYSQGFMPHAQETTLEYRIN